MVEQTTVKIENEYEVDILLENDKSILKNNWRLAVGKMSNLKKKFVGTHTFNNF